MTEMTLQPIGEIFTGFKTLDQCPRNAKFNPVQSTIRLHPDYVQALQGVGQSSHIIVLYWFDQADRTVVQCVTPHDGQVRGVFANRSPNRPNPIALSVVQLLAVEGNTLTVSGLDCLDGTALLDIKPYSPAIDRIDDAKQAFTLATPPTA